MSPNDAAALADRLHVVRAAIAAAAAACGRDPAGVRLVAVSKGHGAAAVRAAYDAGQRDFGESYAGELIDKAQALAGLPGLRWHFVGHLQRNKMARVAPLVELVHGLDSVEGARALDRAAGARGRPLEVLLQVNVAADPDKRGCAPGALPALAAAVAAAPHLRLRGLMTLPALEGDPAPTFAALAALLPAARAAAGGTDGCDALSMGMSDDFAAAIAAGATLVRVGSAIFGARLPPLRL